MSSTKKKLALLSVATTLIVAPLLFSASCGYNMVNEKPIKIKEVKKTVSSLLSPRDFLDVIYKGKTDSESLINKFLETQTVTEDWKKQLNDWLKQYNTLLNKPKWSDDDRKKANLLKNEIESNLEDKWYWFLTNIDQFEFQYDGIRDNFDDSIQYNNGKFTDDFLKNLAAFQKNPTKSETSLNLTYKPTTKAVKGIEIIGEVDVDSAKGGTFYVHVNDYFFFQLQVYNNLETNTPKVEFNLFLSRFSKDKKAYLKLFENFNHQFIFHRGTIGPVIGKLVSQWEEYQKVNGFWLAYRVKSVKTNERRIPVGWPFPGNW